MDRCSFKVGDMVRVIAEPEYLKSIGCREESINEVAKIIKVEYNAIYSKYKCTLSSDKRSVNRYWFFEDMLEPADANIEISDEKVFGLLF